MRYLWHAFFARPDIPLLRLPWNVLGVLAGAVAGWWDPAIWPVVGAGELIYLFTLASNPGFQRYIDERRTGELRGDTEETRRQMLAQVGGRARQRYKKLEDKRVKLEALYRQHGKDDLFLDSNLEALRKLTWIFLQLLIAERTLIVAPKSDERDLQKQIGAIESELAAAPSDAARSSKEATLRLLRERLDNIQHRQRSMAEIEADLGRIEAQFDLALEEASLRGAPGAMSSHIELTTSLLSNLDDGSTTTYSATRQYE